MIGKSKTGSRVSACPYFKKKIKKFQTSLSQQETKGKNVPNIYSKALIQTPKSWNMGGEKMAVILSELKSSGKEDIWR